MIVYAILIVDHEEFIRIGYVRCDIYSEKEALRTARMIPELAKQMKGHGEATEVLIWNDDHTEGDSITSWVMRVRSW